MTEGEDEDEEEKEKVTDIWIQYHGVLNQLVYELVFKECYCPKVTLDEQMVSGIYSKMKRTKTQVQLSNRRHRPRHYHRQSL